MSSRLWVDQILSIGLVGKGDNPESTVMLWKSRDFDKKSREPTLSDYRNQLEEIKKERQDQQEVDRIGNRPKDNNMPSTTPVTDRLIESIEKNRAREQGEEVTDNLDDLVKSKLDKWAAHRQIENEIAGKYGSLSTPRVDQRLKIKNLWWASPDGLAVKELLREQGSGDAEVILKSVEKSHSEAHAAIRRLDG